MKHYLVCITQTVRGFLEVNKESLNTSPPDRYSMRIVIQRISDGGPQLSLYRLVAYGGPRIYQPSDFDSLARLVNALRAALPEFDETTLSIRDEPGVIFAEEMVLDSNQLALLGLKERTRYDFSTLQGSRAKRPIVRPPDLGKTCGTALAHARQ